jgi:formylglycine-generating enzyme required for sulfatase activity
VALEQNPQRRDRYQVQGGGPVLVALPAGRFKMGSPKGEEGRWPDEVQHEVVLSHRFLLGEAPVTQADFAMVIRTRPSGLQGSGRPVERVSWLEAVEYCNALSRGVGLEEAYVVNGGEVIWKGVSCPGFRLPTEAEWEYACRAGKSEARPGELEDVAWYDFNSKFETHPVRWKQPNAWGLHDMVGNVWEWCWDWYGEPRPGSKVDPLGPDSGSYRVNRGGSWRAAARCARAACRSYWPPDCHNDDLGFRLARTLP